MLRVTVITNDYIVSKITVLFSRLNLISIGNLKFPLRIITILG